MSSLASALERVGDRWTLLVVDALAERPQRFNDLREMVAGIAPNILSQRLKRLESEGVVVSRLYSRRPPRAVYELTATGRELAGALRLLAQWGASSSEETEVPHHSACGTPMETRWYCPTCTRVVEESEITEVSFL
jgi:DNA-binding HxlR family transcriptional regulator